MTLYHNMQPLLSLAKLKSASGRSYEIINERVSVTLMTSYMCTYIHAYVRIRTHV